jgi:putative transposase
MSRKNHTAEQIITKLREAEVMQSKGQTIAEACRQLGITETTYYKWRKEYGGLKIDQAKRFKQLEQERGKEMIRYIFSTFFILVTLSGCNDINEIIIPNKGKPDLIIESITYQRQPNCWDDGHGGVVCSGTPIFQFTLKIGNIGDAGLRQSFYISNSRTAKDFQDTNCSHTTIANYPPLELLPNGFMNVTFEDFIDDSIPKVLFVINTNDLYDHGVPLPIIPEKSYDNKSFILDLQW